MEGAQNIVGITKCVTRKTDKPFKKKAKSKPFNKKIK